MAKGFTEYNIVTRKNAWVARHRHALAWAVTALLPGLTYAIHALISSSTLGLAARVFATAIISLGITLPISDQLRAVNADDHYEQPARFRVGSDGVSVGDVYIAWDRFGDAVVVDDQFVITFAPEQRIVISPPGHCLELVASVRRAKNEFDRQAPALSTDDIEKLVAASLADYRHAARATLLQVATNTRQDIALRLSCARALRDDGKARALILASLENIVCDAHKQLLHAALTPHDYPDGEVRRTS